MIEVEKRTLITESKYQDLVKQFNKHIKTTKQITYYFSGDKDFRLMLTPEYTKLWLKEGEIHDDFRHEYEVFTNIENNKSLLGMLNSLNYKTEIKWYRVRNEFTYEDLSIAIDYTHGYGYIIEAELLVETEAEIQQAEQKILDFFKELDIPIIDKNQFKIKYEDYKINWLEYTKDIDEETFLN